MMNAARSMCGWTREPSATCRSNGPSDGPFGDRGAGRHAVAGSVPRGARRRPGRLCGRFEARAGWSPACAFPDDPQVRWRPRSRPRSWMLVAHASLTRRPLRPSSTARAACWWPYRSAVQQEDIQLEAIQAACLCGMRLRPADVSPSSPAQAELPLRKRRGRPSWRPVRQPTTSWSLGRDRQESFFGGVARSVSSSPGPDQRPGG